MAFGMNYSFCPTVYLIYYVTALMARAMHAPVRPAHSVGEARQIDDHQRETDVRVVIESQSVECIRTRRHQSVSQCLLLIVAVHEVPYIKVPFIGIP